MSSKTQVFFIGIVLFVLGAVLLAFSLGSLHFFKRTEINIELREAEEYLRQNSKLSARQALKAFNHILANNISTDVNQKAKYGMAAALELLEENAAALRYYRELYTEDIVDQKVRDKLDYSLGRFYLYLNHESEGRSLLDALLVRTKDKKLRSKVFTAFGMFYLRRKESKRAEENFRVALKYDQDNFKATEGRAQAVKGQGQDWLAYRYYDDYLFSTAKLNPSNREKVITKLEEDIFNSGIKAFRKERYHNAISFFLKLCQGSEDRLIQEKARFWIGESYKKLGLYTKAIKAYDNVLNNIIVEKDDVALFRKGTILFDQNKSTKAIKVFQQLQSDYPDSDYSQKAKKYIDEFQKELGETYDIENHIEKSKAEEDAKLKAEEKQKLKEKKQKEEETKRKAQDKKRKEQALQKKKKEEAEAKKAEAEKDKNKDDNKDDNDDKNQDDDTDDDDESNKEDTIRIRL